MTEIYVDIPFKIEGFDFVANTISLSKIGPKYAQVTPVPVPAPAPTLRSIDLLLSSESGKSVDARISAVLGITSDMHNYIPRWIFEESLDERVHCIFKWASGPEPMEKYFKVIP